MARLLLLALGLFAPGHLRRRARQGGIAAAWAGWTLHRAVVAAPAVRQRRSQRRVHRRLVGDAALASDQQRRLEAPRGERP